MKRNSRIGIELKKAVVFLVLVITVAYASQVLAQTPPNPFSARTQANALNGESGPSLYSDEPVSKSDDSPQPSISEQKDEQKNSLPKKITILGKELTLKGEKNLGSYGSVAEYIPENQTRNNWEILFAVRFFPGKDLNPALFAQNASNSILARKPTDSLASVLAWESVDPKTAVVNFTESSPDFSMIKHTGLVEHDVWRYTKLNNGIIAYQIARRVYASKNSKDEISAFVKNIAQESAQITQEVKNPQLPIPNGCN